MKYKIYLKAIMCDRFTSKFMENCDLGITDVGVPVKISFTIDTEPTQEFIQKIIDKHLMSKEEKSLEKYFTNVELDKVEILDLLEEKER